MMHERAQAPLHEQRSIGRDPFLLGHASHNGRAVPDPAERDIGKISTMKLDLSSTCNIACDYCFVDSGRSLPGPKVMSAETVRTAIRWLERNNATPHFTVVLFGGEPLLNKDGVTAACQEIERLRRSGRNAKLQLITNGILATMDVSRLLASADALVMVSIDGDIGQHDSRRHDHRGRPTYDRVVAGLRNLQTCLPAGRIWARATMSGHTSQLAYFDGLHALGINQISLGYVNDIPPPEMSVAEYERQIDALMERLLSLTRENVSVRIHPLGTYLSLIYAARGRGASWPRTDCGAATRLITVAPDGVIYPCEQAATARHKYDWSLGSVVDGLEDDLVRSFLRQTRRTHSGCASCGNASICDQGCRVSSTLQETRDQCHAQENFLHVLWGRAHYWYSRLEDENPSALIRMVDPLSYSALREQN
jgi:uncharacterized protein